MSKPFDEVWIAVERAYSREFNLWMTVLRVRGVKFEREKDKCSPFIKYWFPKDSVSGSRCSPFHSIHQSNNKKKIMSEAKVSVRSLITKEREMMSRRRKPGTRVRQLWDIADRRLQIGRSCFSIILYILWPKLYATVLFTDWGICTVWESYLSQMSSNLWKNT